MAETATTLNEADWQMSLEQLNESQPSKGIHRESRMQRMLTLWVRQGTHVGAVRFGNGRLLN